MSHLQALNTPNRNSFSSIERNTTSSKAATNSLGASGIRESLARNSIVTVQVGDKAISEAAGEGCCDVGGWDFLLNGELVEAVELHADGCGGDEGGDEREDGDELHFDFRLDLVAKVESVWFG